MIIIIILGIVTRRIIIQSIETPLQESYLNKKLLSQRSSDSSLAIPIHLKVHSKHELCERKIKLSMN
jgi:hypothetical protein